MTVPWFGTSAVSSGHVGRLGCVFTGVNNNNNITSGFAGLTVQGYLSVCLWYGRNWCKKTSLLVVEAARQFYYLLYLNGTKSR